MATPNLKPLPHPLGFKLSPLPLLPLTMILRALMRRVTRAHPEILQRLGLYADRQFLIDPVDLPFVFILCPAKAALSTHRRSKLPRHDARLVGRLSAFLAMLHGAQDGDALFFSRDLTIEGDTAAVLALRNALDDAELDLRGELAAATGRFGPVLCRLITRAERATGLVLHRVDGGGLE